MVNKTYKVWIDEDDAKLKELTRKGFSNKAIATILKRSLYAVECRLKKCKR